jgi:hypothetical protein
MPMPSGRPDNVFNAIKRGFAGRDLWPTATANPESHYQQMALTFGYIARTPGGFILTDLGAREIGR